MIAAEMADDLWLDDVQCAYPDFLVRPGFEGAGYRAQRRISPGKLVGPELPALTLRELAWQMNEVRDAIRVTELGLPPQARNCLWRDGILTVGDLRARTGVELLSIRSFGVGSLARVDEALSAHGLALRPAGERIQT